MNEKLNEKQNSNKQDETLPLLGQGSAITDNGTNQVSNAPKITQYESTDDTNATKSDKDGPFQGTHRRTRSRGGNHHRRISSTMSQVLGTIAEDFPHKVTEGLNDAASMVQDAAETFQEAVVDEMTDIKDNLMEELHEADVNGNSFFMEMSLTRNLSILPSDVEQVAIDTAPEDSNILGMTTSQRQQPQKISAVDEDLEKQKLTQSSTNGTNAPPFSAYFLLASAVISLSSIGPLLEFQKDVIHPTLKILWRQFATSMILLPFAFHEMFLGRTSKSAVKGLRDMTIAQWTTFFLAAASYAIMCVSFVLALQYTSVGNAVILANSQAMLLLIGKLCVGSAIAWQEGLGAVVAFAGAILCSLDSSDTNDAPGEAPMAVLGDFLGMVASIGGVGYLIFAKTARSNISLFVFMYLNMLTGAILDGLFTKYALGIPITFDTNDRTGVFGWMAFETDRLPLELTMVIICNMFGSLGYVRAMQYFDNLVLSVAALSEPVVAELMAFFIGVAVLPGIEGWIGNVLVIVGTLLVIVGGAGQGKSSAGGH